MVSFMSESFLEIVELPGGEIVLRRHDEDSEQPLVTMTFSKEVVEFFQGEHFSVASAMLDVCFNEVNRKNDGKSVAYIPKDRVLH